MNQGLADAGSRVIGTKQTVRALERGCVSAVYIASDAEEHVIRDVKALCGKTAFPLSWLIPWKNSARYAELMWVRLPPLYCMS